MAVRRRYYVWLFKAYIKRWKRTILASLIIGAAAFFCVSLLITYYFLPLINRDYQKIGYSGAYTLKTLPDEILSEISYGLTQVEDDGKITPGAAGKWTISEDGKTYEFELKNDQKFSNGEKLTTKDIPFSFSDASKKILSETRISYALKDPYSPFLTIVSKPILKKNFGLRDLYISKVDQNAGFVKSITISQKNSNHKKIINFYPTQEALLTAFQLGEVNEVKGLSFSEQPGKEFSSWKNISIVKEVDSKKLVALFFNTLDSSLGNKKIRQALLYALPPEFDQGKRTYSFIPSTSLYYSKSPNEGLVDLDLSKSLMKASSADKLSLTISTTSDLVEVAKKIASSWKKINVDVKIQESQDVPVNFTVFLYSINLPKDPDMYTLWHSEQVNNITHYKNVRIDKLLEDGRQITDVSKRQQIYADVQKYLLDDSPAAFLYFPYVYTVVRK